MPDSMNDLLYNFLANGTIKLRAIAVDGPNEGQPVEIKAKYNTDTGNYELLTAGSGGTTTSDTTNTLLLETGYNLLLETGDELLLEA